MLIDDSMIDRDFIFFLCIICMCKHFLKIRNCELKSGLTKQFHGIFREIMEKERKEKENERKEKENNGKENKRKEKAVKKNIEKKEEN